MYLYTIDEIKEAIGVERLVVNFIRYYKYEFDYVAEVNGYMVRCSIGGDRDAIYRLELEAARQLDFNNVSEWNYIYIENPEGERVFEYCDY